MHHYHKLQELIGSHPVGAPKSEEYLEILKILFRPEEVELAAVMDFKLRKAGEIAEKAGIPADHALEHLEEMADRGVVLAKQLGGEPAFALLPNYPGLFEYPVMKGTDPATERRLAELWHAYYMKDMAAELALANPPWNRVFPAEEALTDDIEILPYEVASKMMEKNEVIALANCPCRTLAKNCDKPLDVCLAFDGAARFLAERGMAKTITLEEAREVLKKAEEAGLVHTGNNNAERLIFMCNCCPCCCHFLMLITKHNYTEGLARSSYQAKLNADECIGCSICADDRCPVGAFTKEDDVAVLDVGKCIGCGLCVSTCPTSAITLEKRADYQPPPANVGELTRMIVANKRK